MVVLFKVQVLLHIAKSARAIPFWKRRDFFNITLVTAHLNIISKSPVPLDMLQVEPYGF
jgi:hypothetical protein